MVHSEPRPNELERAKPITAQLNELTESFNHYSPSNYMASILEQLHFPRILLLVFEKLFWDCQRYFDNAAMRACYIIEGSFWS